MSTVFQCLHAPCRCAAFKKASFVGAFSAHTSVSKGGLFWRFLLGGDKPAVAVDRPEERVPKWGLLGTWAQLPEQVIFSTPHTVGACQPLAARSAKGHHFGTPPRRGAAANVIILTRRSGPKRGSFLASRRSPEGSSQRAAMWRPTKVDGCTA